MFTKRWATWLVCLSVACLTTSAGAQQFVSPGAQSLPYGGVPALRVAPDGAVHLDGPGARYSQPTYAAAPGQRIFNQQGTTIGQGFSSWLYNDPVPWQYNHRTGVFGDFLYLRPRNAEVSYALPIDGPVALGDEVPVGPVAVVDPEFEPAFRAGAVLCLTEGASIRGQYTYFRSEATDSATVTAPNVLRPLVMHPSTVNAATDPLDANARLDIDYDLVDIDYRGLIIGCESCDDNKCAIVLNGILGGRYVNFEQEFSSNFTVLGNTAVESNIDFRGGGIRLGIEGEHHATASGFYVYGSGITNLMIGEFKANYRQTSTVNGVEAFTSWQAGRIVPSVDLEMGLGWVGPRRRLRFSGGYLVSTWFNVVTTDEWIEGVQQADFNDLSGIMTFDGLVARATFEF